MQNPLVRLVHLLAGFHPRELLIRFQTSGPRDLLFAVDDFNKTISMVILELSDAAANLGSGVAEVSANYDATEEYNRERAAKLGVEWNK